MYYLIAADSVISALIVLTEMLKI